MHHYCSQSYLFVFLGWGELGEGDSMPYQSHHHLSARNSGAIAYAHNAALCAPMPRLRITGLLYVISHHPICEFRAPWAPCASSAFVASHARRLGCVAHVFFGCSSFRLENLRRGAANDKLSARISSFGSLTSVREERRLAPRARRRLRGFRTCSRPL